MGLFLSFHPVGLRRMKVSAVSRGVAWVGLLTGALC
jgi:hypothetical protein